MSFKNSADEAIKLQLKFIIDRIDDLGLTVYQLSKSTQIPEATLHRMLRNEVEFSHRKFLMVLGALNLRPYLIPSEIDQNEMKRIFFN